MSLFLCYVLHRSVSAVWSESLKVVMHQIHQCDVVIKSCFPTSSNIKSNTVSPPSHQLGNHSNAADSI